MPSPCCRSPPTPGGAAVVDSRQVRSHTHRRPHTTTSISCVLLPTHLSRMLCSICVQCACKCLIPVILEMSRIGEKSPASVELRIPNAVYSYSEPSNNVLQNYFLKFKCSTTDFVPISAAVVPQFLCLGDGLDGRRRLRLLICTPHHDTIPPPF